MNFLKLFEVHCEFYRGGSCTNDRTANMSDFKVDSDIFTESAKAMDDPTILGNLILNMKNLDYLVATTGEFSIDEEGSLLYAGSKLKNIIFLIIKSLISSPESVS